jgi:hypothetical protein
MDLQRPIIEQVQNSIPDTTALRENIGTGAKNAYASIADTAATVRNTLGEFGSNLEAAAETGSSSDFLDMNGMFAKIAFLILILFVFLALLRLGISLVGYFTLPSQSPYVVKGILNGNSNIDVSQNPEVPGSILISRSNDANKGAEFTWSVWLFINQPDVPDSKMCPIFVKGEGEYQTDGINTCNGPGMYVTTNGGIGKVRIVMDTVINKADFVDIPNIPQQKWVHIAVRLQNTLLDTYVNGVISARTTLSSAPKQNYYDIHICPNGGFSGSLSDLRYFDHALSVFGINNIVMFGPTTTTSALTTDAKAVGGNYSYLSSLWYGGG